MVNKILVTGATGYLGRHTLAHLLAGKPASQLVGLVRDRAKAADLLALGIEIRQADYLRPDTLVSAFAGIEKVMLTSAHAFTDRDTAHGNVIEAAAAAGVDHLVFMSIIRNTDYTMKEITTGDTFAEQKLLASGLAWTLVKHPPFLDVLHFYIGAKAHQTGIHVPAGAGKFAAASRDDLAAAHAAILSGSGHKNKTYVLTGAPAVSFEDIAGFLSAITGRKVPYVTIPDQAYLDLLKRTAGVPDFIAEFALAWVKGMNAGEWRHQTGDLEMLIGRHPTTAAEFFRDVYVPAAG